MKKTAIICVDETRSLLAVYNLHEPEKEKKASRLRVNGKVKKIDVDVCGCLWMLSEKLIRVASRDLSRYIFSLDLSAEDWVDFELNKKRSLVCVASRNTDGLVRLSFYKSSRSRCFHLLTFRLQMGPNQSDKLPRFHTRLVSCELADTRFYLLTVQSDVLKVVDFDYQSLLLRTPCPQITTASDEWSKEGTPNDHLPSSLQMMIGQDMFVLFYEDMRYSVHSHPAGACLVPACKSAIWQMRRTSDKKNLFVCYDRTAHKVNWLLIDKTRLNGTAAEDLQTLSKVMVSKKVSLKRFDFFKMCDRDVVFQSEFWDCWCYSFQ